jgi:adenylosuccinate lyase
MIARYTRKDMGRVWSDENKYACWLEVELAASEALAELGEVPREAATALRAHAGFSVARIDAIEAEVRHDVIAFTTAVSETMAAAGKAEASRWFHYGLTSNDVVDTAQSLQLKKASELILAGCDRLLEAMKKRAFEFKDTPQIGRTHGIQAEPITFGLKVAHWYDELRRNRNRFAQAADELRIGKMSGAVGTFGHISPEAEELICRKLGLEPAAITTQVIPRDRHAAYVNALAVLAAGFERVAMEVRHLQRTEVREAEEPFGTSQKGSSAMPHKRNPVVCEQICGLARLIRSNAVAGMENISLWHERDISHSSVERVILPDSTILADYLIEKVYWLVSGMRVNTLRMRQNLELTRGLVFSGQVLLDLAAAGMLREQAYKVVQSEAMKAWESGGDFRAAIEHHPQVSGLLSPAQIEQAFSLERQLTNVGRIFSRVFDH